MRKTKHGIYGIDYEPLEDHEAMSLLKNAAKAMKLGCLSEIELKAHAATLVRLTEEFPNVDINIQEDTTSERIFQPSELRFSGYE